MTYMESEILTTACCPHCRADMDLGPDPMVGDRFTCDLCRQEFELLWLFPIELGLASARDRVQAGAASTAKHKPN